MIGPELQSYIERQAELRGITAKEYLEYVILNDHYNAELNRIMYTHYDSGEFNGEYPKYVKDKERLYELKKAREANEDWENGPDDHRLYPENNKDCRR